MTAVPPDPTTGLASLKAALDLPKQVIDLGCDLVRDLIGEPVKVAGGMLSDQFYWWQWRNRVRIASYAAEIMERDGIARRVVPPSFLLPLLEAAGNVEDPDLQEMWARLLASGVAADEHQHPRWRVILEQLSAEDGRKFRQVCSWASEAGVSRSPPAAEPGWSLARDLAVDPSIARLASLDLVVPRQGAAIQTFDPDTDHVVEIAEHMVALPTRVGAQFRRAVMPVTAPTSQS